MSLSGLALGFAGFRSLGEARPAVHRDLEDDLDQLHAGGGLLAVGAAHPITNTAAATITTRSAPSAISSAINMACPRSRLAAGTPVA